MSSRANHSSFVDSRANSSSFADSRANSSTFDEQRWVIQIRRHLKEEVEEDRDTPVCIFSVPPILVATDPKSYVPQQVALGPYHHWRPELFDMQRSKISAAKRTQKQLHGLEFEILVKEFAVLETRIRACYHKYLDLTGETLAWMMAVDTSFLLEFLHIYFFNQGQALRRVTSKTSDLVNVTGKKPAHNAVLRDMVMLENQVPLFLLTKMLEFQYKSSEAADDMLNSMLLGFYKAISPFKMMEELPNVQIQDCAHLLKYLYRVIVPKSEEISEADADEDEITEAKEREEKTFQKSSHVKQFLDVIWKFMSKLNAGPVSFLKKMLFAKPVALLMKLPWTVISKLPVFKLLKQPIESMFFSQDKEDVKPENEKSDSIVAISKPPLIEEIAIPSVTELAKAGVCFLPTNGGVFDISFDSKSYNFYLPVVSLDVNTEVLIRNLVAYEASNASGPLVFTRYTELMNGIIDTEEDAKLLRERGIVFNHLKSDKEVAKLWNGMSKSIKLTKVPFLDQAIEDVNKHYHGRWKVKFGKFLKNYVFESWKLLTLIAAVFMLLLTTLQAFCSVYSCRRVFHLPSGFE